MKAFVGRNESINESSPENNRVHSILSYPDIKQRIIYLVISKNGLNNEQPKRKIKHPNRYKTENV